MRKQATILGSDEAAARSYVLARLPGLLPGCAGNGAVRLTYLDAGVMNYVFRAECEGHAFYLKQALSRVKEHSRLGRDLASVSPARIGAEARALSLLGGASPPDAQARFPRLLHFDAAANVLWTDDLGPGIASLQDLLLTEPATAAFGRRAAGVLSGLHAAMLGRPTPLWRTWEEDRSNWRRFLRMRTWGFLDAAGLDEDAGEALRILGRLGVRCEQPGVLSHLDAAPKNWLLGPGRLCLLDFELGAAISDPAYDPGFLAGHLLLLGVRPDGRNRGEEAAEALAVSYAGEAGADQAWKDRFDGYAAAVMLYRICGSSPAPYLAAESLPHIRREASARLAALRPRLLAQLERGD